ncbi:MAG: prenyltransferase/squalene oxidase repeat-containing protein [Actinomycetota bacterium]
MTERIDLETLRHAANRSAAHLLAARTGGHWRGKLSSSALSTATAIIALALVDRETRSPESGPLIRGGVDWLLAHQNKDGGWGDTVLSSSNISTTALVWSALAICAASREDCKRAEVAASGWLQRAAQGHGVANLRNAIAARYGKDHTFSVPILTVLALAGKLGPSQSAWRHVPQLPFELAACPHEWFKWLKLPVVSYALPALIAIGQVRHRQLPAANPIARLVRNATRARTLRVLESIQPDGGGFLEATPLTSFVTMSLVAAGSGKHRVVQLGAEFLRRSVQPDGSWPIDTDLATWVTTLAVNALAGGDDVSTVLNSNERESIRSWLLNQQYRTEHPYTRAAPGGWAWTDLPGGVPDADDTPGALLALHRLGPLDDTAVRAAEAGITWLLDLQNADGGMPTFCRGWGTLPFDRSGADLTAHAVLAWITWHPHLRRSLQQRLNTALPAALTYLQRTQRADGSWAPLWFGNQHAPGDENPTYGTSRVLIALHAADGATTMAESGRNWLLRAQNGDGGWGGDRGAPSSIEETSLAASALMSTPEPSPEMIAAIVNASDWLVEHTEGGERFPAAPIGFYFAKLWYFEELYPLIFSAGALTQAHRFLATFPRG